MVESAQSSIDPPERRVLMAPEYARRYARTNVCATVESAPMDAKMHGVDRTMTAPMVCNAMVESAQNPQIDPPERHVLMAPKYAKGYAVLLWGTDACAKTERARTENMVLAAATRMTA